MSKSQRDRAQRSPKDDAPTREPHWAIVTLEEAAARLAVPPDLLSGTCNQPGSGLRGIRTDGKWLLNAEDVDRIAAQIGRS